MDKVEHLKQQIHEGKAAVDRNLEDRIMSGTLTKEDEEFMQRSILDAHMYHRKRGIYFFRHISFSTFNFGLSYVDYTLTLCLGWVAVQVQFK